MELYTTLEALDSAVTSINGVVADRMLQEDLKNIIFKYTTTEEGTTVHLMGCSFLLSSFVELASTVKFDGEETSGIVQVRARELYEILACFKGLRVTKVSGVTFKFDIEQRKGEIIVHEEAKEEGTDNAEKYKQDSRFKLKLVPLKEVTKSEVTQLWGKAQSGLSGMTQVEKGGVLAYLNALVPTLLKDGKDGIGNRVFFTEDYIYTVPQLYVSLFVNELPSEFSGYVLNLSMATFMQSILNSPEDLYVSKDTTDENIVVLTFKTYTTTAIIKAVNSKKAYNIQGAISYDSTNGLGVDKDYFMDVVKRASLANENVNFEVDLDSPKMTLTSKNLKQDIPLLVSKGEGKYKMSLKPEVLSCMSMLHATCLDSCLFFYFTQEDRGTLKVVITDGMTVQDGAKHFWHTTITGVAKGTEINWD